jgi:hypothetical protein
MSLIKAGFLVAFAGLVASLPVGCSDDGALPNATFDGGGGDGGFGGVATGPCKDGESRKCGIELAKHGDIVSCYVGTHSCQSGTWGQCGDGTQITKSVSAPPGVGPGSGPMNSLGNCAANPCDPYCQNYNNDAGYTADGGAPIYVWQGGSITGLPNGLVTKGLKQPCLDGADCQFNTYCWHPKTSAGCGHSKCQTGGKLDWGCDPCVAQICKADHTCCNYPDTANGGNCAHSICTAGGANSKLAKGCDSAGEDCTTKICNTAGLAYCCQNNQAWDAACVAAVNTVCGLNCATLNGAGSWTAACVAEVATSCDATCGAGAPPPEEGKCKEWLPGQTDPSCPGIDLAGDIPCAGNIPICNHGQTQAPAGIRVVHYPANSNQYPKCDPDQSHPQMYECFTTKAIKPGECTTDLQYWDGSTWKAGCDQLVGNREIMINPQIQSGKPTPAGYAGYVAECSCKDNWTLFSGGTCGAPTCGGDSQVSTFKKVNYLVMMDRSGSMNSSGLWNPAVAGLTAFYQDPTNAGLGVAMEFYPTKSGGAYGDGCAPGGASQCNSPATPCSNAMVPLGILTAGAAPGDAQEAALIASFASVNPSNNSAGTGQGTPTYPALEGSLIWAMNKVTADPTQRYDVILLTDGDPSGCDQTSAGAAALAANALATKGVKTHVIGMPGSTTAYLNPIAFAGGTNTSITVGNATMATDLKNALTAITGGGITCASDLPPLNLFDPFDVKVIYTESNSNVVPLAKYADSTACGTNEGWYYDNNATPTKILLCPTSCTKATGDAGSKIDITLGCPKGLGPQTILVPYQGQCAPGSKPVWNFLAYNASTPNTSTVEFRARTADTQGGLPAAPWHNLAISPPTPANCPLAGPNPCPVDVFAALGFPDQKRAWLELEITLTPGGGGVPVVNSFDVTYSCPPSE